MERIAPAGDVYQAGHAEREPARGRRRAAPRSRCSTSRPTCRSATPRARWPTGCARRRATARSPSPSTTGLRDRLLRRRAADGLRGRRRLRHRGLRRLVPRAAGPRRLPARRRSSRPGSRPPRTRAEHIARTVEAAAAAFAEVAHERARATLAERSCASEGGLLAGTVRDSDGAQPQPHGDAVAGRGEGYPLLVEAIREGYLQHYAAGRVVRPEDPDLALLAGDRLYALGLERLAAIGDLDAVGRARRRDRAVRAGPRRGRSGAR